MVTLVEHLHPILDLPHRLLISEARTKLIGTYILVNNKAVWLNDIGEVSINISTPQSNGTLLLEKNIQSLSLIMPDSGVYSDLEGLNKIIMYKKPNRQWKKSFSPENYSIIMPNQPTQYFNIDFTSRQELWMNKSVIMYYEKAIGMIQNTDYFCTDRRYEQEIQDGVNYGRI